MAGGEYASLEVVDVPTDDPDGYVIDEYDGLESIHAAPAWDEGDL